MKNNHTFSVPNLAISNYLLERAPTCLSRVKLIKSNHLQKEITSYFLHLTLLKIPIGSRWHGFRLGFFFVQNDFDSFIGRWKRLQDLFVSFIKRWKYRQGVSAPFIKRWKCRQGLFTSFIKWWRSCQRIFALSIGQWKR